MKVASVGGRYFSLQMTSLNGEGTLPLLQIFASETKKKWKEKKIYLEGEEKVSGTYLLQDLNRARRIQSSACKPNYLLANM
jgi:hypothetical protein